MFRLVNSLGNLDKAKYKILVKSERTAEEVKNFITEYTGLDTSILERLSSFPSYIDFYDTKVGFHGIREDATTIDALYAKVVSLDDLKRIYYKHCSKANHGKIYNSYTGWKWL